MAAPPPPTEAPPPSPPSAPPPAPPDSTLDLDLDFIAFDNPQPQPVAGPSKPSSSTPLSTRNGRAGGPSSFPPSLPSRPGTPAQATKRSASGKGKNKRSNDEVDYAGEGGEADMDFDRELDIDPRDSVSMRRLRARGIPWAQNVDWTQCQSVRDMLNAEAVAFWHYIRPTQVEHNVRGYVIDLITNCIRGAYHDAQVHVFGSYRTGLYLPYGDIDLVVESPSLSSRSNKNQIHQLAALLRRAGIAHSVQAILGAKVPIVKFKTVSGDFAVDISVGQLNGIQSGHIIRNYFRAIPAMQPLIYLVKHFLWQRSLNEVFTGGLGSYSTILLVISFLQMHPKLRRNEMDPMKNLGLLLMEFFETYGSTFNSERSGISLRDGGSYFDKYARGWETKDQFNREQKEKFSIEDPQDPSNDVSRGSYSMRKIKGAFSGAFARLQARMASAYEEQQNMLARMRNPNDPILMSIDHPWTDHRGQMVHANITVLGCILGLDDEVISHRARIAHLYNHGHLQRTLEIAQNAKPASFAALGDAAWVSNLDGPAPPPATNNGHASSRPASSSRHAATPSSVSGVRSVSAIMVDDAVGESGPAGSRDEPFAMASDSDSAAGDAARPGKSPSQSKSQKRKAAKERKAKRERAEAEARDAESKYAISRPGKSRRGTYDKPLEVSDSDSLEMDVDDGSSDEDGRAIGPEEYAQQRRKGERENGSRPRKRSRSSSDEQEERGKGKSAKSTKPKPKPLKPQRAPNASHRSIHRDDSRSSTPDKRSGDRNGSTAKKVRQNERAAYWASKGGIPADEAEQPATPSAPATFSIKGRAKQARQSDGAEAFADNADFIAL